MNIRKMFLVIVFLAIGTVTLAGCGSQSVPYTLAAEAAFPDSLRDAPPRVREAYRFAVANPQALETIPCYCGCGAMGHKSNLMCYINEVAVDGTVKYDNHAAGCGICVDITQDVMRLMTEGRTPKAIRTYVDATYSSFGPSTDTVLPTE
jgi:hypothetical protein